MGTETGVFGDKRDTLRAYITVPEVMLNSSVGGLIAAIDTWRIERRSADDD